MSQAPNMSGLSRKHIQQGCEASLRRLGVETIDLYQVHRFDPRTPLDEMLSALDLLVRQGKVAISGRVPRRRGVLPRRWRFPTAVGGPRCREHAESLQPHLPRGRARDDPLCEAEGIAVIPWSPLARGLLTGTRKTPDDRTATVRAGSDDFVGGLYDHAGDADVMRSCQEVAAERGISPLKWPSPGCCPSRSDRAHHWATKLEHLDTAIAAVEVKLSQEEIRRLEAPYRPHAVRGF